MKLTWNPKRYDGAASPPGDVFDADGVLTTSDMFGCDTETGEAICLVRNAAGSIMIRGDFLTQTVHYKPPLRFVPQSPDITRNDEVECIARGVNLPREGKGGRWVTVIVPNAPEIPISHGAATS